MMGSASKLSKPKTKTVFVEDLPPEEVAKIHEPSGLINLGNTCYLNSVVQCLRKVPQLRTALNTYQPSPPPNPSLTMQNRNAGYPILINTLRDTLTRLDSSTEAIPPANFVMAAKSAFPQFGQTDGQGRPMQQDAEEFFSGILSAMAAETTGMESIKRGFGSNTVITEDDLMGAKNFIDAAFGLKMEETLTCDEFSAPETTDADVAATAMEVEGGESTLVEPPVVTYDLHRKLVCNIQGGSDGNSNVNVNHIQEGILLSLEGKIEKHSEILGRNALWTRKQRIKRLPPVFAVQFGRFYWKATPDSQDHAGVKCKVMKPVTFMNELDVYEFCSDSVKKVLKVHRDNALKEEEERLAKKLKADETKDGDDEKMEDTSASGTAADDEEAKALLDAIRMSMVEEVGTVGPDLPHNFQGMYELFGVVTHKGRNADGGHYMGWVKADTPSSSSSDSDSKKKKGGVEENDDWYVFDDDEVSPCKTEDVLKLKGGGDWHMSYLNFYRAKK